MKLPIAKFLPKKQSSEYLLALLLRDEKASAVIVEQIEGKVKVIGQHIEYFTTSLEDAGTNELLEVLDKTISKAEETLPPNVETKKTIFGVKDEWVEEKKIKKEHLLKLKKVSEALFLTPVGFLVVSEAVSHLIQEEEGAPLSAILAEIGTKSINLVLFRGGKIVDSKRGPIEESPMQTVDSLLKHFTIEVLPSRIILFDGKQDSALIQKFITHQWSKSLPFLHVPQISVLPENFDARSIVFGAATQMGLEILGEVIEKGASEIKTYEHGEKVALAKGVDKTEEVSVKKDTKEESETEESESTVTSAEGTNGDEDPTGKQDEAEEESSKDKGKNDMMTADNFGFVNDQDIEKMRPQKKTQLEKSESTQFSEHTPNDPTEAGLDENSPSLMTSVMEKAMLVLGSLGKLPGIVRKAGGPLSAIKGNRLILIPLVVIMLLIGLGFFYISIVKANVTLNLTPQVVGEDQKATFSTEVVNDFAKQTIQASAVSSTLEGSVSTNATGKKDVGEKAKGTITLFNNNDSRKTLAAGIVISSSNNLDYVLDKEVAIASQSGDPFTGTKPGTVQASVTAKAIGPDYNLPSGAKFTVPSAANVVAKNDAAFSGGSKKQVVVVAKKDTEKLLSELPKSLGDKVKNDMKNKVDEGSSLLPDFTDISVVSKKFDKEIDAEAKTVTLKGKVTFEALTYSNKDLQEFATSVLKSKYAQNLRISDKGADIKITGAKKTGEKEIEATIEIKANLLPTINTDDIRKKLAGKSKSEAEKILEEVPQVASSTISLSPPIPFIPQFLPRGVNNISVGIQTNE